MTQNFSIYCDESCHLQNDEQKSLVFGAVWAKDAALPEIFEELRELKSKHGLSTHFEAKWTKISASKEDYYKDLVEYFYNNENLGFRAVVVPDKNILDHEAFGQDHDTWYYKMFFLLLKFILQTDSHYSLYLDIKDTRSVRKVSELKRILNISSSSDISVTKAQQIRSHEVELMQVTDILIGALSYKNRELSGNAGKLSVIKKIEELYGRDCLLKSSPKGAKKFNVLIWKSSNA